MITIIDYNAGNVTSVVNALKHIGAEVELSSDPAKIQRAEKLIFPGQGAAGAGMKELEKAGLIEVLKNIKAPFLGICLGMQLLFEKSEENDTQMLGIIPASVERFDFSKAKEQLRVPQVGWNLVKKVGSCPLLKNIPDESYFYFVHSYAAGLTEETVGLTLYGGAFTSIVQKDNFYGVQFHPEKSGELGQQLLKNFMEL